MLDIEVEEDNTKAAEKRPHLIHCRWLQLRMAEQVAAATQAQMQAKIMADLQALKEYYEEKQEHANRSALALASGGSSAAVRTKGNLDMQYLSQRYDRGVQRVGDFMRGHQRYIHCPTSIDNEGFPDALAQMQCPGDKPLGFRKTWQWHFSELNPQAWHCDHRHHPVAKPLLV